VEEKAEWEAEAGLMAGRERVVKFGIEDSKEPIPRIVHGVTLMQERPFW